MISRLHKQLRILNVIGCALSLCVRTVHTTAANGIALQKTLSTWVKRTGLSTSEARLGTSQTANGTALAGNKSFHVNDFSRVSPTAFLGYPLALNVTVSEEGDSIDSDPSRVNTLASSVLPLMYGSDIDQILCLEEDLVSHMSNMTECMRDTVRNLSPEKFNGTAHGVKIQTAINQPWLVLPAGLVLSSYLLLVVTIALSSKHHTQA